MYVYHRLIIMRVNTSFNGGHKYVMCESDFVYISDPEVYQVIPSHVLSVSWDPCNMFGVKGPSLRTKYTCW